MRIETHGEPFDEYIDSTGKILYRLDGKGNVYGADFIQMEGISLSTLKQMFDTFMTTSLPSQIDEGTF